MVDKELIEIWRNMLKPAILLWLLNTNYEEMGEQDKEEFERDFDEILDLALIGLKYKAQLSQKRTEKRTETRACDLISRQAAIDEITEYGSGDTVYMSVVELKRRIEQLPPAQPEQRWIPCSERLPEESGYYIVTAHDGTGHRTTFVKYQKKDKSWYLTGARSYWRVIAWMPLPEPYKAEAERRTDG